MSNRNQMKLNGKDVGNPTAYLTIDLADDYVEVRGFGKPITSAMTKKMINEYGDDILAAWRIVQRIDKESEFSKLKKDPDFKNLKSLLNPSSQVVSGVFGKEIILQILSLRNCEGIRYVIGKDEGHNTIILVGVEQTSNDLKPNRKGTPTAQSRPLSKNGKKDGDDGEVHENSLTLKEALDLKEINDSLSDVLLGTY